jgi:hypothetical protein
MKSSVFLTALILITHTLRAETLRMVSVAIFEGTSTLHSFKGEGTSLPTPVTWTPVADGGGILKVPNIRFTVKDLTTHHKSRDQNMMKMFNPGTHPLITGEIKEWRLGGPDAEKHELILHINGETFSVPVTLTAFRREADEISFSTEFSLSQGSQIETPLCTGSDQGGG